jgi:poly(3-hydroxybutyrate) depolymerase
VNVRRAIARARRARLRAVRWRVRSAAACLSVLTAVSASGVFGACDPVTVAKSADDPRVLGGVAGARVDLGAVAGQPGLAEYEIDVPGQGARSIDVWMPETAVPDALILFLHGAVPAAHVVNQHGKAFDGARELVSCLAAPGLAALNPLIIAPRSPTGQWWNRSDTEFVLGLVLAVRERWPAAGDHAVISGYSNGGIGAWYFARLYPDYFRAAVPIAFSDSIVGETRLPVYGIEGTKDEMFDFESVRAAVEAQRAKGQDVTLKERYRGTHLAPCSYVPELASAAHWLETQVFQRSAALH